MSSPTDPPDPVIPLATILKHVLGLDSMRVLIAVIASVTDHYDAMKAAWIRHFRACPQSTDFSADLEFLYGVPGPQNPGEYDTVFPDVRESLVPGILQKTTKAFRESDHDFVVRTNLSSWFHWRGLRDFLRSSPSTDFVAGYSPTKDHLSGCNFIASRDVIEYLGKYEFPGTDFDDLELSRAVRHVPWTWVSRIDLVYASSIEIHGDPRAAFHVRLKHDDRTLDVRLFDALVCAYSEDVSAADLVLAPLL